MKRIIICLCLLSLYIINIDAQISGGEGVQVTNLNVANNEGTLFISMDMDFSTLDVNSNQEVTFTPMLVGKENSLNLNPVIIAGRTRYYRRLRSEKDEEVLNNLYRNKEKSSIHYLTSVPYEKWMEQADLILEDSRCKCRNEIFSVNEKRLTSLNYSEPKDFVPHFIYISPQVTEKHREASGSAYIDFPVSRTEINTNYRNNAAELRKILSTIDSVKSNPDARITEIRIKGFASPEGTYATNQRLAKGRTESLIRHIQKLYSFAPDILHTDYEAEDWNGLRNFVEKSDLFNKAAILEIIDSDREPDPKEWKLKSTYPGDYRMLVRECYPSLRHSDYAVEYTVKSYADVEEAKRVMSERPGNLSLHEFYKVANSYKAGSPEYNEVFNTMVRVYPNDPVANLNAANVAMMRRDLKSAASYLQKAGNTAEADYARGVLEALNSNFSAARSYLNKAKAAGIKAATNALKQIDEIEK